MDKEWVCVVSQDNTKCGLRQMTVLNQVNSLKMEALNPVKL